MNKSVQKKRLRTQSDASSDGDELDPKQIHIDGYDDKYLGNAEDRAWLKTLSEREREAELLKRHEQREILKHREEISKKLKSKDPHSDNDKKNRTSEFDENIYDQDDKDFHSSASHRKQTIASRQKNTQHSKSLEALIQQRKQKDNKTKRSLPKPDELSSSEDETAEKLVKSQPSKKLSVPEVYASDNSDTESDDRRRSRSPENKLKNNKDLQESIRKKNTYITTRSQLKPMILSRFRIEKWCHAPFFADVVKGAFVRINIGQNKNTSVYRLCQVRDVVVTSKVYNLGKTRTNKGLRLKHGHNERVFRLEFVSNREVSDSEFQYWREALLKTNTALPTLFEVEKKQEEIEKYKKHVFSNQEITKIIEEKKRFQKTPINYAVTKQELLKDIEMAKDENNTKRVNELRKQLDEMEKRASEIDRIRTANNSILTVINQRNRRRTQQNIENALASRARSYADIQSDPFTRRRCAPKLVSKAVLSKEELVRELHLRRTAEEEAEKNRRLTDERKQSKKTVITTTPVSTNNNNSRPIPAEAVRPVIKTSERGSFTMPLDNNDEIFSSHNFELDVAFKFPAD